MIELPELWETQLDLEDTAQTVRYNAAIIHLSIQAQPVKCDPAQNILCNHTT